MADRFKDLFEGRSASYGNLCALFCHFLLGFEGLSPLVRACPWAHSVSDLSRSIRTLDANRFMRRLRSRILRHYDGKISPDNFCYAVDDTANPKYGKGAFRCGSWHSSSGPYFGQKILVVVLVDINRRIALPLGYIILPKKDDPSHRPAHKLACDLLQDALNSGLPPLPVAADSWFDSTEFMAELEGIGLTFAGEIKGNRRTKPCPSPKVSWRGLSDIFLPLPRQRAHSRFDSDAVRSGVKRAKCFSQRRIWIKNRKSPLNVIAVYNRKNGTIAFAYYATTDLNMAGSKLWEISRGRWKIECLFRDLKQCLSFGKLPCQGIEAAHLAVCLPFALITSLRLDGAGSWGLDIMESIGKKVAMIREEALQKSVTTIIGKGNDQLKEKLRSRRQVHRLNQKPVDQAAEAA